MIEHSQPVRPEDGPVITPTRRKIRPRVWLIGAAALFVVIIITYTYWRSQQAQGTPFSSSVMASVQFPLYFPTYLPPGFHINPSTVTEPEADVVVITIDGPKSEKLFMSEEARPANFNLGGFYASLSHMSETSVSDGAIAAGYTDHGLMEVASRANNTTWILSNTKAALPLDELTMMLKSLRPSY